MRVLKKTYIVLFLLGIFFLPFNSQIPEWLSFLGEYKRESSPIFFLLSFFCLLLYTSIRGKIYIPYKSVIYGCFILFLVIMLSSTLINLPDVLTHYYKKTNGVNRFFRQYLSVIIIGVCFFLVFINACRDYGVNKFFISIRKVMFISFLFVFTCGMLEFLIVNLNASFLESYIEVFNYFPFVELGMDYRLGRLSATTYEPPALGAYLITISGFMFSYVISSKKSTRYLPFLLVVVMAVLSKSRTALVAVILQLVIAFYYAYKAFPRFRMLFIKIVGFGIVLLLILFMVKGDKIINSVEERLDSLNIAKNIKFSSSGMAVSNKSRLGIQVANFEVFKQNPIFGVGWGQQSYLSRHYYPDWAIKNNYEFRVSYLNENVKSFPPGYNMYLRILTETGIIGFFVFTFFIFLIYKNLLRLFKNRGENSFRYITIALIISFLGYFLNWLQIDSFRVYGFWLCTAILIELNKKVYGRNNSLNTTL